jgi:hypothetical protein
VSFAGASWSTTAEISLGILETWSVPLGILPYLALRDELCIGVEATLFPSPCVSGLVLALFAQFFWYCLVLVVYLLYIARSVAQDFCGPVGIFGALRAFPAASLSCSLYLKIQTIFCFLNTSLCY